MKYSIDDRVFIPTINKGGKVHHQPREGAEHIAVLIDGNSRPQYMPVKEVQPESGTKAAAVETKSESRTKEQPAQAAAPRGNKGGRPRKSRVEAAPAATGTEPSFEEIVAKRRALGGAIERFDAGVRRLYQEIVTASR